MLERTAVLALLLLAAACGPPDRADLEPQRLPAKADQPAEGSVRVRVRRCCVWIDLDGTLNTFGAWGFPLNPVPAAELCEILSGYERLRAAPLTARRGCLPAIQPLESECSLLHQTVSVECSSGEEAAAAKRDTMRGLDGQCSRHVLIDDNEAARGVAGGAPEIRHVLPVPFDWPATRRAIVDAIDGC